MTFMVTGAFADAGNPILGTIKATAVDNNDGTVTIFVRGQWNWLSHNNDCNDDRNGAGVGIIWNDTTEPGYLVANGAISARVGIASLRAGDAVNQVDQMVHPSDRGNVVEGYTVAGTDYPAGQAFVDPAPGAPPSAASLAAWRGGCGRLPLTATASKGTHPERTGLVCAGGGSCSGRPWGSWGYEKNGGKGYSHTYLKSALPDKVCVNFYDVHGSNAGLQAPKEAKEITVDANGDNSIDTNSFNVNNGANCIQVSNTTTSTDIHNGSHAIVTTVEAGTTVHDSASVTSAAGIPSGTVKFDWFTNGTCTGNPQDTSAAFALTNGQADTATPGVGETAFVKGPLAAGLYGFKAHYLGDNNFMLPSDGPCEPLRVVDAKISISPSTATNRVGDPHVFTAHVEINDGTGWSNAPTGTAINFSNTGPLGASWTVNQCTTVAATGSCTVTLTSSTTGVSTVTASTSVLVSGFSLTRSTDGTGLNSGPATKTWVNAKISIAPSATNRVGAPHTFTVTLLKDTGNGAGFVAAQGEHVSFSLTDSSGAASVLNAAASTCDDAGANTDAGGQCTIVFASNSTGKVTGHAASTLTIGAATFTVETDGTGLNSGNAVKTYVNAKISITPPTATNRVGAPHTFTVTLLKDIGNGGGLVAAANEHVDFTLTDSLGATSTLNALASTCDDAGQNTDANGKCTIVFTSNSTGKVTGHASSTLTLAGLPVTVETDGAGLNSGDAVKTFVNAKISITPSTATNRVRDPHTFTVTLLKDVGDGAGFVAAQGEHVTVTLTDSLGATHTAPAGTCTNAGGNTNASGQCAITFTSNDTGKVTAHASSTLTLAALPVTVQTDGVGLNSGNGVKTFVDAKISITPSTATNRVRDPHTFTVTLLKDVGDGAGFVAAAGEHVSVTLTDSLGATHSVPAGSCTNAGANTSAIGQCTITFTSNDTGKVTAHAASTLTLAGLPVTVETDGIGLNSGNGVKTFVDAKITIAPDGTHEIGQSHTFTVTLWKDTGNGAGFVQAGAEDVDFTLTDSNGAVHTAATGSCTNAGANTNASGECTITTTSNTTGQVTAHASSSLTIAGLLVTVATNGVAPNSGNAVATFVDANVQITPANATNPLGTNHVLTGHVNVNAGTGGGFVNAPNGTTINFSIVSGPGGFIGPATCNTSGGTGSCTVTISSATTGTTKIRAATDVSVGGVALHRESNDGKAGDSIDATKLWASAKITIVPNETHEVGTSHTFTVTLLKDTNGTFVPASGEHVAVTLTDASGAAHTAPTGTCTSAGANTDANGQCTITFTSSTAGTVTGHASATLAVGGAAITVATNGIAGSSNDAIATFVDANIQITPATAINPISTNHTLTGHVNVATGSGGYANAPNGTTISFTLAGPASFVGPSGCTTSAGSGSCTVVITSNTTGSSTIKAKTDVAVGGVTLHRESGDAKAGDSVDASKLWADDAVRTDILNASGAVVTTVAAGTIVHDKVFVAKAAGTPAGVPAPTGSVVFHRFATIDCTGTALNQTVALIPGSPSTALSDDFAPAGNMSYQAEYLGDANYGARTGACEPLTVTPVGAPAIAIVKNPKSQTVAAGGTATFTISVTNVGNTVLTDVHVVDPLSPNCNRTKATIPALASMAPGSSVTYTCTRANVKAGFDNVATATGTPPSGPNVTASDTAPVKVKALTPAKKKVVKKKKKPKVVSHKKPKATG